MQPGKQLLLFHSCVLPLSSWSRLKVLDPENEEARSFEKSVTLTVDVA